MNQKDLKPAGTFAQNYGVKMLAYGPPGQGKTPLIKTAPRPVLLFTEPGMLSMRGSDVPAFEGNTVKRIDEFFEWVEKSNELRNFDTVGVDSVSNMAEIFLNEELPRQKDPRKAYGNMSNWVMNHLNMLYYMKQKHAYLIAKERKVDSVEGASVCSFFPGQDLSVKVPHLFDLIARVAKANIPGMAVPQLAIRCIGNVVEHARDRTGNLAELEPPHLANLFAKAMK